MIAIFFEEGSKITVLPSFSFNLVQFSVVIAKVNEEAFKGISPLLIMPLIPKVSLLLRRALLIGAWDSKIFPFSSLVSDEREFL